MARIARRRVLALSASGGMAAILASGRSPAIAQETSVHWADSSGRRNSIFVGR
jgi:hypothetical protein